MKGDHCEDGRGLTPLSAEDIRLCEEAAEDIARARLAEDDERLHDLLSNPFYVHYADVVGKMVEEVYQKSYACA